MKFWLATFQAPTYPDGLAILAAETASIANKKLIEKWREDELEDSEIKEYLSTLRIDELSPVQAKVLLIQY